MSTMKVGRATAAEVAAARRIARAEPPLCTTVEQLDQGVRIELKHAWNQIEHLGDAIETLTDALRAADIPTGGVKVKAGRRPGAPRWVEDTN